MRCIPLTGSDNRMDCRDMFYGTLNPLPPKCRVCGFPDLEHIPQPYFLVKSRTLSPVEMAMAENGNFLVRTRVRRILELLAPGQCRFFPTTFQGSLSKTPWHVAVPNHQVVTAAVKPWIPRCDACGEPRSAHPGSQYDGWMRNVESDYDMLKSATWGSSERGWDQWMDRTWFLSVRMFYLLQKVKVRGLHEATCQELTQPNTDDTRWIAEKLHTLEASGIPFYPAGALSGQDAAWLRHYIRSHVRPGLSAVDIQAAGKRLKFKLPKSYVAFVTQVGPVSFKNVEEQPGVTMRILTPEEIDAQTYRASARNAQDAETNAVDGVMFAETEHGDGLCFDVNRSRKEFPVLLYMHEYDGFEPYADNFAACLKRLSSGNDG